MTMRRLGKQFTKKIRKGCGGHCSHTRNDLRIGRQPPLFALASLGDPLAKHLRVNSLTTGRLLEGKCGFYRVQLHGTEQVLHLRTAQLDMSAVDLATSPRTPRPRPAEARAAAASPTSPPPKSASTAVVMAVHHPAPAKGEGAELKLGCSKCRWTSCKRCRSKVMEGRTFEEWSVGRGRRARQRLSMIETGVDDDSATEEAAKVGPDEARP